ncbi:MAG: ABC transporter permease [Candidatus Cloacimonetes bacterium]|jgi:general nucleoside transport system permease protein|nr:ABC transporter permease [Candidatus Cloacimonadota bacterium]MBT6994691.1 ABC transporter permease [Candidatus Cloacimonadota bacterium]MBT7468990.1 ABC transporter permease [Candidatus Cloacimonadota bacterium]
MFRIKLEQKERVSKQQELIINLYAIAFALILSGIFIALNGANPFVAFWKILTSVFGSRYGFSETLVKSIPLIFTGLSVAIALNSKIWNIGAEGQLFFGAIFATAFVIYGPVLPRPLMLTIMVLLGMIGGAVWAAIPALLKIKFKMNEVISTLLLNYVAINIADYFLFGAWKGKDNFPYTPEFPLEAKFPRLNFGRVHFGFIIAILLVILLYIIIYHTRMGYKLRLTGSSLKAAKYAGIEIKKMMFLVFLISGALAGLAGVGQICGIEYKLHQHISNGYGYTGIIVAWLARSNPFVIVFFAFFLSILLKGVDSLQIVMHLPAAVGVIIQSLILFAILGGELFKNYNVQILRRK